MTKRHGKFRTTEYRSWIAMRVRCLCKTHKSYEAYTALGICDRWLHGEDGKHPFECFLEDMGPKPDPAMSLDRERNEEGYKPDNCRWATVAQQHRNRSDNIWLVLDGERMTLGDAVKITGVRYNTARWRFRKLWSAARTLGVDASRASFP